MSTTDQTSEIAMIIPDAYELYAALFGANSPQAERAKQGLPTSSQLMILEFFYVMLDEKDRIITTWRLCGETERKTLEELGGLLGITREGVRQRYNKSIDILRAYGAF